MNTFEGIIIKGIGGFYYVEVAETVYECKARGVFRKQNITPTVGDRCVIEVPETGFASIAEIKPRKNILIRPTLANLDKLIIVVSACKPKPNYLIIDRLTSAAIDKEIKPIIAITKTDLADAQELLEVYEKSCIDTIRIDYETGEGIERVREELKGCISGFAGNSGVGKSTLINAVEPELKLATGEISDKLGRGRHTTRSAELFDLSFGGKIADTPGFASFDGEFGEPIDKDNLQFCFPEFEPYIGKCKFTSCAHLCERGCEIVSAAERGDIAPQRHESYCALYREAKERKEWN